MNSNLKKQDLSAALRGSKIELLSDMEVVCDSDVVRLSAVLKAHLRKGKTLRVAVLRRSS